MLLQQLLLPRLRSLANNPPQRLLIRSQSFGRGLQHLGAGAGQHLGAGAGQHLGAGAGQQGAGAGAQTGAGAGAQQGAGATGAGAGAGAQQGAGAGGGQTGAGAGQHVGAGAGQHLGAGAGQHVGSGAHAFLAAQRARSLDRSPQLGFSAQQSLADAMSIELRLKSENAIAKDSVPIHPKFRFMGQFLEVVTKLLKQVNQAVEAREYDPTVNHL